METKLVLVAERREIFREGLAHALDGAPNIRVVGKCGTSVECLKKAREFKPDIVLLDSELLEGYRELVADLIAELPEIKIILVMNAEQKKDLLFAFGAGVRAYISADINVEQLIRDIYSVSQGEVVISSAVAAEILKELSHASRMEAELGEGAVRLSEREIEIIRLVAMGSSNRDIARRLFISENTVKGHMSRIMEKLHVHKRQQAVIWALERHIINPNEPHK